MPRPRRKPKDAYHHGNLRAAIAEVASAIVHSDGAAELTVRAVARRLGVTHAAIYHHFEGRTDLLAAVTERGFEDLGQTIDRAMAQADGALMRFREHGLIYLRFAVQNPNLFRMMCSEASLRRQYPSLAAATQRLLERFRVAIVACQAEGALVAGVPDEHALFCWSGVHGLASLIVEQQLDELSIPADLEARAAVVLDRIFTGLGALPR
jgi:AcrR family transcriptional regulator